MGEKGRKDNSQNNENRQHGGGEGRKGSGQSQLAGTAGGDTRWQGLTPPGVDDANTGGQALSKMTDQETSMAIEPAAINAMSPARFDIEVFKMATAAQFGEKTGGKKNRAAKRQPPC